MKLNPFFCSAAKCLVLLFLLSGCKKATDYLGNVQDHVIARYRIKNVQFGRYDVRATTFNRFDYDSKGNLVRITNLGNFDSYYPSYIFKYDSLNRLTGIDRPYSPMYEDEILLADTYVYTRASTIQNRRIGRLPADTFGLSHDDYRELKLDDKGRVIKETVYKGDFGGKVDTVINYQYDGKGNLILPGVTYTSKPNIRRLNKIFMLMDRNYSENTAANESDQFNEVGLPVRLKRIGRDFLYMQYTDKVTRPELSDPFVEYTHE